jgi:hypothetical protein
MRVHSARTANSQCADSITSKCTFAISLKPAPGSSGSPPLLAMKCARRDMPAALDLELSNMAVQEGDRIALIILEHVGDNHDGIAPRPIRNSPVGHSVKAPM